MTYDDNSMLDLLTNTSNVNSFAKAVGDFTSELARPIIDHKKIDAMETIVIVRSRQNAEVRKCTVEAIRQALISGNLAPEAQQEAIRVLENLILYKSLFMVKEQILNLAILYNYSFINVLPFSQPQAKPL